MLGDKEASEREFKKVIEIDPSMVDNVKEMKARLKSVREK
jgi:hypothetical protein